MLFYKGYFNKTCKFFGFRFDSQCLTYDFNQPYGLVLFEPHPTGVFNMFDFHTGTNLCPNKIYLINFN